MLKQIIFASRKEKSKLRIINIKRRNYIFLKVGENSLRLEYE